MTDTMEEQRPGRVKVPWTEEQENELRSLAQIEDSERWEIGDAAVAAVPMGDSHANNQARHFVTLLAQRVGVEPNTLRNLRAVAHAWPQDLRRSSATWNAHKAYTKGGPKNAEQRGQLFDRIAVDPETPFNKVTAPLVKKFKPQSRKSASGQTKAERRRNGARYALRELRGISTKGFGPEDQERFQHVVGYLAQLEEGTL